MFAGIMQRPRATSLRISSASSFSRLATYCISSVITPCRAKFICDMFRLPFAFAASASRFSIQPSRNAITPPRKSLSPGGPGPPSIARHSPATRHHEEQIMAPGNGRGNFAMPGLKWHLAVWICRIVPAQGGRVKFAAARVAAQPQGQVEVGEKIQQHVADTLFTGDG